MVGVAKAAWTIQTKSEYLLQIKTYEKQEHYSVDDIAKGTYIVKITTSEGQVNKTLIIE